MNHKNKFRIDAFTGAISTKAGIIINDEENAVYDLSVVASDRGRPALRYFLLLNYLRCSSVNVSFIVDYIFYLI